MTELSSRSCEELLGCVFSNIWEVGGYIWIFDGKEKVERCCVTDVRALSRLLECLRTTNVGYKSSMYVSISISRYWLSSGNFGSDRVANAPLSFSYSE